MVSLADGTIGGADFADKTGHWRLQTVPGNFAVIASIIPFKGGKVVDKLVAIAHAKAGKTSKLTLKLKKKKKKHRKKKHHHAASARIRAAVNAGFGDVSVGYPAIWVHHFDVNGPADFNVMSKGLADMMITDLVADIDCQAVVVERERIDDILNEQRLQHTPGFDQSTAVPTGHLIRDNSSVNGSLTVSGNQATLSATYANRSTGKSGTVSVSGPAANLFQLEEQLAQKLADLICSGAPPFYDGTASGSQSGPLVPTQTWSAQNVRWAKRPESSDLSPIYDLQHALVNWSISGGDGTGCTYSGNKQIAVGGPLSVAALVFLPPDLYHAGAGLDGATATITITCPDGGGGTTSVQSLWVPYPTWLDTSAEGAVPFRHGKIGDPISGSADENLPDVGSVHWQWSFEPKDS
jgi:hypothetical protein